MTGSRYRAFPVVLSAPSGTGKTTIAREVVSRFPEFVFSVSVTTRAPRPGEADGRDYYFVSRADFQTMIEQRELAEWAEVHGHFYGTPTHMLEEAEERGVHAVLDIDVQGAFQVRESIPNAVLIFVFPPSATDLVARLTARGTEKEAEVRQRLQAARSEFGAAEKFDYVIVNDDLSGAVEEVRRVAEVEGLASSRWPNLSGEVERIQREIDEILAKDGALGLLEG